MKEKDKLCLLELLRKHVFNKDGFWILDDVIVPEETIRVFIRQNWEIGILERDITDCLSELSYNIKDTFNVEQYFVDRIVDLGVKATGKSKYFASLDKLYPGNKFREIMNYYLINNECYSFILIGYGQTGKTTFVSLIAKILGEAYFGRSNVGLLRNGHGTAILEGKRLFEVAEAQDLDLDTANTLKSMITNDDIYINPKFQLPRTITPHIKMIMTCNNMPRFKVTDDGIIRRFIIVEMNKKITRQNKNFLAELEEDIPNIVAEAIAHPFHIEDFALEQYAIFENDPQYGFGYGKEDDKNNIAWKYQTEDDDYSNYVVMCKALGYHPRSKANFDKFNDLAKIYGERKDKVCVTTSKDVLAKNGIDLSNISNLEDLPF